MITKIDNDVIHKPIHKIRDDFRVSCEQFRKIHDTKKLNKYNLDSLTDRSIGRLVSNLIWKQLSDEIVKLSYKDDPLTYSMYKEINELI